MTQLALFAEPELVCHYGSPWDQHPGCPGCDASVQQSIRVCDRLEALGYYDARLHEVKPIPKDVLAQVQDACR